MTFFRQMAFLQNLKLSRFFDQFLVYFRSKYSHFKSLMSFWSILGQFYPSIHFEIKCPISLIFTWFTFGSPLLLLKIQLGQKGILIDCEPVQEWRASNGILVREATPLKLMVPKLLLSHILKLSQNSSFHFGKNQHFFKSPKSKRI